MNGILHDLIELMMYEYNGQPYCQVYFGGRMEPYDVVRVDEFLGDILELCSLKDIDMHAALNSEIYNNSMGNDLIKIGEKYFLMVSAVIVECYPRKSENTWMDDPEELELGLELGWKTTDVIDDALEFMKLLSDEKVTFTRERLELFTCANSNYCPPYTMISDYRKYIGNKDINSIAIKEQSFETSESLKQIWDKESSKYTLYTYECDLMEEVIISLLHYLARYNKPVKRCSICGRYFSPINRTDEKYCSRSYVSDTCKIIGKREARRIRMQTDAVTKKYNSVCTNLSNRIYASKIVNNPLEQENRRKTLEKFREEYQVKKKKLTEEKLLEWMDSMLQKNNPK